MKKDYNSTSKSGLALENNINFSKHQSMLKSIPTGKKLVFEQNSEKDSLLDESNIKEQ
jgi:mannose/fructose/N-acetylgalactosamine-specific phosphotransferase system component IID